MTVKLMFAGCQLSRYQYGCTLWTIPYLYLYEVDRFQYAWLCGKHACVEDPPGRGDDLSPTTMDGIRVKSDIVDVETNTTKILLT